MDKPRYVDPNSGAAPQPGGVAGLLGGERGHAVVAQQEEDSSKEQIVSPDGLSVYPNEPQPPSHEVYDAEAVKEFSEAERVELKQEEVGGSLDGSYVDPAVTEAPQPGTGADGEVRTEEERAQLKAVETGSAVTLGDESEGVDEDADEDVDEVVDEDDADAYDPGEYSVAEVNDYLEANPDQRDAVVEAERAGKGRKGITGDE